MVLHLKQTPDLDNMSSVSKLKKKSNMQPLQTKNAQESANQELGFIKSNRYSSVRDCVCPHHLPTLPPSIGLLGIRFSKYSLTLMVRRPTARLPWMIRTYEILPIAEENKYLGIFSYFIMK